MNQIFLNEDNELFNNFLEDYFYKNLKKENNDIFNIELIISPKCNLGCRYCYIHKYGKDLFPSEKYDETNIINNLKLILKWFKKQNFHFRLELFSGELFAQKIGYEVLDEIVVWLRENKDKKILKDILIPTNFTFLMSEKYTEKIEKYIEEFHLLGANLVLSASFDGKFCETNRPYKKNLDINFNKINDIDLFYDKVFSFCSKYHFGFHPMIYSKNIEKWKENFLWFQEQFKKYNIPWNHMYLLQVRNVEWTDEQIKEFYNFIYFLYEYTNDKLDGQIINKVFKNQKIKYDFNILFQPFGNGKASSKGLGCSLQNTLTIRLSDLKVFPCHRLMYHQFEIGEYDKQFNFKTKNAPLGLTIYGVDITRMQPFCNKCEINYLCAGQCLGSQYEVTDSLFVPIQTVCKLQYALILAAINFFKDNNLLLDLYKNLDAIQIEQIKDILKKEKNND